MKLSSIGLLGAALAVASLFTSGCVTDDATPSTKLTGADMGPAPAGVNTVKMTVDGSGPEASVSLNGIMVGYTPRDIHLEVNPDGRLPYAVTITIAYKQGATRQTPGASTAQAQGGSYTYAAGDRVPAMLEIYGPSTKHESKNLAPWDTKPAVPSARRAD